MDTPPANILEVSILFVTQLKERSLLTPKDPVSNPHCLNIYLLLAIFVEKTKLNKKRQGMANFSVCEALILFEHLSLYHSTSWYSLFQSADSDHRVTTAYLHSDFISAPSLFLLFQTNLYFCCISLCFLPSFA